jgi:hypothetical protein
MLNDTIMLSILLQRPGSDSGRVPQEGWQRRGGPYSYAFINLLNYSI